jgi:hypothetical protein
MCKRTQSHELCQDCLNLVWQGSRLEAIINVMNGEGCRDKSDDEVNSTIFMILNQCAGKLTCRRCRQLVLDRLPSGLWGKR